MELTAPAGLDDDRAGILLSAFEDLCLSSSSLREGNKHTAAWTLRWVVEDIPAPEDMASRLALAANLADLSPAPTANDVRIEAVPQDINWLEHSYRQFPPFEIAGFFIFGSHYTGAQPADLIPLQIDAATAFGSGEHGTTAGCLEALRGLYEQGLKPRHILDMGTGSGILAIAAWKLWRCPVMAVDIDPEAVRVTEHHARLNDVPLDTDNLTAIAGDGFASPLAPSYNLVIANILAGPLVAMAADLQAKTAADGKIILSGMLNEQADEVHAAYNLSKLVQRLDHGEWTTLVLDRT